MLMMECAAFDLQRVDTTGGIHIVDSAGAAFEEFEMPIKVTPFRNCQFNINVKLAGY